MALCGSAFDPTTSNLAGLSQDTLTSWLATAQTALMQLSTGSKVAQASYTQGDGSQSVSYTQADAGRLQAFIMLVQAQLGIRTRRPVRMIFR